MQPIHLTVIAVVFAVVWSSPSAGEEAAATLAGTVRYEGAVPKKADPDDYGRRRPLFDVNNDNAGLAGAIVYLEPPDPSAVSLPLFQPEPEPRVLTQRDFTFVPHILVVPPGQTVIFGNDDPANHNIRAETTNPRNAFNVITTPDQSYEKTMRTEPGDRRIRLACDVHAWMTAWLYVLEHRLFALTDERGAFAIPDVPPATYRIVVEQPDGDLAAEDEFSLGAGQRAHVNVTFAQTHLNGQNQPGLDINVTPSAASPAHGENTTRGDR